MWLELLREALQRLWTQKLYASFAILGIFWGVYLLTLLMSLGQGLLTYHRQAIEPYLKTSLYITTRLTTQPYHGLNPGRHLQLSNTDINDLAHLFPAIMAITPLQSEGQSTFTTAQKAMSGMLLQGVAPDARYFFTSPYQGRFFNKQDIQAHHQVAFLSAYAKNRLFPNQDPMGKDLSINQIHFQVIGYAKSKRNFSFNPMGILIPYSVFADFYTDQNDDFLLALQPGADTQQFQRQLLQHLSHILHFSPKDPDAIYINNLTQFSKKLQALLNTVKYFLAFCGVMSLMVGGISTANMMYLRVKERSPEIGLKMALGARPSWILFEIVGETCLLVISASALALILAGLSLTLLNTLTLPSWLGQPTLMPEDFGLITGSIMLTALAAGYFPARAAAKMTPVIALNAREA